MKTKYIDSHFTLRNLLEICDWHKVSEEILVIDRLDHSEIKGKKTIEGYAEVKKTLLDLPKTDYEHPILVSQFPSYIDVCFLNQHYDVNDKNSGEELYGYFSDDWSKVIDAPVYLTKDTKNLPKEIILAHILWEHTFYGFSEQRINEWAKKLF